MAVQNIDIALLKTLPFLAELSDGDLAKIAAIARSCKFETGTVLFQEGAVCDELYLITSGSVALDMHVPRRGQIRILTLGPGDILAWSAILGDQRMTTMATVVDDVAAISLPGGKLRALCNDDHDVGYAVMQRIAVAISRRLLATRLQLLDLYSETQPA